MTHEAFRTWVSAARGGRVILFLVRERSRGLLVRVGFRAAAIKAKAKMGHLVKQDK